MAKKDFYTSFRRLSGVFVILLLLGISLGFYFFKFIPEQKAEFHRIAFIELDQLHHALIERNTAYKDAIENDLKIRPDNFQFLSGFFRTRKFANLRRGGGSDSARRLHPSSKKVVSAPDYLPQPPIVRQVKPGEPWILGYPVRVGDSTVLLYHDVDSLMRELVATYKDIFDGFLLIRDSLPQEIEDSEELQGQSTGSQIIFKSTDLAIDYKVNSDSLTKKEDGFSLENIRDVKAEGNSYKLFLLPFKIGAQRMVLTGLIRSEKYKDEYLKVSFNLIATVGLLILLLLVYLPIIKIYLLSSGERIRDIDIRFIIGSYFIAAFIGFFIFSEKFLDKAQRLGSGGNLECLAGKITHDFEGELDDIQQQLNVFDSSFREIDGSGRYAEHMMTDSSVDFSKPDNGRKEIDRLLKPGFYPYLDNLFWTDSLGRFIARWPYKVRYNNSPLIQVCDRPYFRDFQLNRALCLEGRRDSFTIMPNLSKLDGEYIITILMRSRHFSDFTPAGGRLSTAGRLKEKPFFVGLGTQMHSMSNVVLPPGYGFSIIDEHGEVQYDSKAGRPLLSNVFEDASDPGGIALSVHYRTKRLYDKTILRGRNVALFSTPLKHFPYQLLVYSDISRTDAVKEHLIGITGLLTGTVLALLIFSTWVNQRAKKRFHLLHGQNRHFEWLYPSAEKVARGYYKYLLYSSWAIFLLYALSGLLIELLSSGGDFSLVSISLLFPFYVAILYHELRERYYDVIESRKGPNSLLSHPSLSLRGLLLIIILLINGFYFQDHGFIPGDVMKFVFIQAAWIGAIYCSCHFFKQYSAKVSGKKTETMTKDEKLSEGQRVGGLQDEGSLSGAVNNAVKRRTSKRLPVSYVFGILTGVLLIGVIPASSIFCLIFMHESSLDRGSDLLVQGRLIERRRMDINEKIKGSKFSLTDSGDLANLHALKFGHGIYLLSGEPSSCDSGEVKPYLPSCPDSSYVGLHRALFPEDSIVLGWVNPYFAAADSSWYFAKVGMDRADRAGLYFSNMRDGINPPSLFLADDTKGYQNGFAFVWHQLALAGAGFDVMLGLFFLLSQLLAFWLTRSLARLLFLFELQHHADDLTINYAHLDTVFKETVPVEKIRGFLLDLKNRGELFHMQEPVAGQRTTTDEVEASTGTETEVTTKPDAATKPDATAPRVPGGILETGRDWVDVIGDYERHLSARYFQDRILELTTLLAPFYTVVWQRLAKEEKFVLYDFSLDGFTNYKMEKILTALTQQGLLRVRDMRVVVMTISFREYVLRQSRDRAVVESIRKASDEDSWKKFKIPFYVAVAAIGLFVLFTQDSLFQKITGLITSLTSILPLLTGLFTKDKKS